MGSFISPLGIEDTFGTNVGDYHIEYDPGILDMVGSAMAFVISALYSVFVQPPAGIASYLLQAVSNPQRLISTLERGYSWLLSPLTRLVTPTVLGVGVASVFMLYITFKRSGFLALDRRTMVTTTGGSYLLVIGAVALMSRPFYLLHKVFTLNSDILRDVIRQVAGVSVDGTGGVTAHYITFVTQLINFGHPLNQEASSVWSKAMASGTKLKDIPQFKQIIDDVSPGGIFTAMISGLSSTAMIIFAIIALFYMFYYMWELTWRTVAAPYFMLYVAVNFRRMDLMGQTIGRILSYVFMCMFLVYFTVAGPILATVVVTQIFGNKYASLQLLTATIVYAFLSWAMIKVFSPTGRFAEVMRLYGRNQWGGYMQTSSILAARAKSFEFTSRVTSVTDRVGRAAIKATTGIELPEGLSPGALLSTLSGKQADRFNEAKGGGVNNEQLELASSTAFPAAEPAVGADVRNKPAVEPGGRLHALTVGNSDRVGELTGTSGSGSGGGTTAAGGAAVSVSGGSISGGTTGVHGTGTTKAALPPGVGDSTTFATPGDRVSMGEYLSATRPSVKPKQPGKTGTGVEGGVPTYSRSSAYNDGGGSRVRSVLRNSVEPMFYSVDSKGDGVPVYDPRIPVPSVVARDVVISSGGRFATPDEVKGASVPAGVAVFNGHAVWTKPQSVDMARMVAPVPDGTPDTVTPEGVVDVARNIDDAEVRSAFMDTHGITQSMVDGTYGREVTYDGLADNAGGAVLVSPEGAPEYDVAVPRFEQPVVGTPYSVVSPGAVAVDGSPLTTVSVARGVSVSETSGDAGFGGTDTPGDDTADSSATKPMPVYRSVGDLGGEAEVSDVHVAANSDADTARVSAASDAGVSEATREEQVVSSVRAHDDVTEQIVIDDDVPPLDVLEGGSTRVATMVQEPGAFGGDVDMPETSSASAPRVTPPVPYRQPSGGNEYMSVHVSNQAARARMQAEERVRAERERQGVENEVEGAVVAAEMQSQQRRLYAEARAARQNEMTVVSTPRQLGSDGDVLERSGTAGRANRSVYDTTHMRGVDIPRTYSDTPLVTEQTAYAASVRSAVTSSERDAYAMESKYMSASMATGGVCNVDISDPSLDLSFGVSHSGDNVVTSPGEQFGR